MEISGQVALVTGAGRGIGREVAHQLGQADAFVIVTARRVDDAVSAADMLRASGADAMGLELDVTDDESVVAAAAAVTHACGRLDILVNNAAAFVDWDEKTSNANLAEAHRVLETNLFGPWRMIAAFLPLLRDSSHPRIVNVSSGAGSYGDPTFGLTKRNGVAASYGISKAALNALTATVAAELAGTHILVNVVCPGLTATWEGADAMGARPVEAGAASVLWAATLDDDGPSGKLFRDGQPLPW